MDPKKFDNIVEKIQKPRTIPPNFPERIFTKKINRTHFGDGYDLSSLDRCLDPSRAAPMSRRCALGRLVALKKTLAQTFEFGYPKFRSREQIPFLQTSSTSSFAESKSRTRIDNAFETQLFEKSPWGSEAT